MSRSAAARADRDSAPRAPRRRAPAVARRVSGPLHPQRRRVDARAAAMYDAALAPRPRLPSRPPLRLAAGGASVVLRVAEAAMDVSGSRTMDRLVRSRGWVVIVAFSLIGIVAMQVSLLKLNAGIGRAVETVATLERGNATLRGEISRLSSGDRIQALAGSRGYVMPEPADVTYLRARDLRSDALRAARRMRAPDATIAGPAGAAIADVPAALTGAAAGSAPVAAPASVPTPAPIGHPVAPAAGAAPNPATAPAAPAPAAAPAAVPAGAPPPPVLETQQVSPAGGVTVP